MSIMLKKLTGFFKDKGNLFNSIARHKATDVLEWETSELENIFALLVFGSFVGIPTTPGHITLALLPYMEEDLLMMLNKVATASGPISDLFSKLDIG